MKTGTKIRPVYGFATVSAGFFSVGFASGFLGAEAYAKAMAISAVCSLTEWSNASCLADANRDDADLITVSFII